MLRQEMLRLFRAHSACCDTLCRRVREDDAQREEVTAARTADVPAVPEDSRSTTTRRRGSGGRYCSPVGIAAGFDQAEIDDSSPAYGQLTLGDESEDPHSRESRYGDQSRPRNRPNARAAPRRTRSTRKAFAGATARARRAVTAGCSVEPSPR